MLVVGVEFSFVQCVRGHKIRGPGHFQVAAPGREFAIGQTRAVRRCAYLWEHDHLNAGTWQAVP
jgi:hypothetical protein